MTKRNTKNITNLLSVDLPHSVLRLRIFYTVGNPRDQMTRYTEFVTIFSSASGRIFFRISRFVDLPYSVLRLRIFYTVGNPRDQMTRYTEFVTIFSSASGRIFFRISRLFQIKRRVCGKSSFFWWCQCYSAIWSGFRENSENVFRHGHCPGDPV